MRKIPDGRFKMPGGAAGAVAFCALFACAALPLAADEEPTSASAFFSSVGFGAGLYSFGDGLGRAPALSFTPGIDARIGGRIDDRWSVFLLTQFSMVSFRSVADFSDWVFSGPEYRRLLVLFIPVALLCDSQTFVGPGVAYRFSPAPPAFYLEGGAGYASVQSVTLRTFVMGAGLFAGLGVEITPHLDCGLRAVWAPSFLHSGWTPSADDFFSLTAFLRFM